MSGKATGKQHGVAGRQSLDAPDPKKTLAPAVVCELLAKASAAIAKDVEKVRFTMPAAWLTLRPTFHTLHEDDRRFVLLKLLLEEAERIQHDHGARIA